MTSLRSLRSAPARLLSALRTTDRRRLRPVLATSATLALLIGGSVAAAETHKTVTLDVDGELVQVSTFSGSVGAVLDAQGVELGERDIVAPDRDAALREGEEIVVRHARALTVLTDGHETTLWTTALSAQDALTGLAGRGADVSLVASRSLAGRADLSVLLNPGGPVALVVDGRTEHVADGALSVEDLLASFDVTVGPLDRVAVRHTATGPGDDRLTLVVQRVVVEEQPTLAEIPFESVTQPTEDLFRGESRVDVAGVPGERTTVHRVVLVDGVPESSRLLSDLVTREPVAHVVVEGTTRRPAPAPAPVRASAPAPSGGGTVVGGDVWAALARCESGGNPTVVSASGTYHGLYQFSVGTWESVGGSGLPSAASASEQTERAQALQARSGWGQWPSCARSLGLL